MEPSYCDLDSCHSLSRFIRVSAGPWQPCSWKVWKIASWNILEIGQVGLRVLEIIKWALKRVKWGKMWCSPAISHFAKLQYCTWQLLWLVPSHVSEALCKTCPMSCHSLETVETTWRLFWCFWCDVGSSSVHLWEPWECHGPGGCLTNRWTVWPGDGPFC